MSIERALNWWLHSTVEKNGMPRGELLREEGKTTAIRIGNCTVLDAARTEEGYGKELRERDNRDTQIFPEHETIWLAKKKELKAKGAAGICLRVVQFTPSITDASMQLKWREIDYIDGRAFHSLLESDHRACKAYRETALRVMGEGTRLPNILSTAVVVIAGSETTPELVIAHRKPRSGSYHGNRWAVTIGEQFKPLPFMRNGKVQGKDASVIESVVRGLREELLPDEQILKASRISIHAFCMEDYLDNFMFLAVADVRPLGFDRLASLWERCEDRAEHDGIAMFPATEENLRACIDGDCLPRHLWTRIVQEKQLCCSTGIQLNEDAHNWQSNSHVRLAAAWWYATLDDSSTVTPSKGRPVVPAKSQKIAENAPLKPPEHKTKLVVHVRRSQRQNATHRRFGQWLDEKLDHNFYGTIAAGLILIIASALIGWLSLRYLGFSLSDYQFHRTTAEGANPVAPNVLPAPPPQSQTAVPPIMASVPGIPKRVSPSDPKEFHTIHYRSINSTFLVRVGDQSKVLSPNREGNLGATFMVGAPGVARSRLDIRVQGLTVVVNARITDGTYFAEMINGKDGNTALDSPADGWRISSDADSFEIMTKHGPIFQMTYNPRGDICITGAFCPNFMASQSDMMKINLVNSAAKPSALTTDVLVENGTGLFPIFDPSTGKRLQPATTASQLAPQ